MYHIMKRSFNHKIALHDAILKAKAPSIFASQPMVGVTAKYTFLPTARIVDEMRANGWSPVDVQEQRVRLEDRKGFQKHLIRFQRTDILAKVGEYAPEIVLLNSHDRSSAYQIHVGIFRFVCCNGLMIADSTFQHASIRHSGHEAEEVLKASFAFLEKVPELSSKIEMFKARRLTTEEQQSFAKDALELRYDEVEKAPIRPDKLLVPRIRDDNGDDLWLVFNRVQQNLVLGGLKDYTRADKRGNWFPKTRAITGLDQSMNVNKGLWGLAEKYFSA